MTTGELLCLLATYAGTYRRISKKSIIRNKHMNNIKKRTKIKQKVIDAILVDFINFIGIENNMDFGLYTKHL